MTKEDIERIERTKRERANSKRKLTRKCNAFMNLSERNAPFIVLQETFDDIRDSYKEIANVNDNLTSLINETAQHDVMDSMLDDCDAYMKDIEETQDQIRIVFASNMPGNKPKSAEVVRVKPLEAPNFSGNIREYSCFKQDFIRLMVASYGEDPYALRSCLTGPALDTVRGAEDNYHEMLRRFEDVYGDPRKVVDAVIQDIRALKPVVEGDSKVFLVIVEVIERCWLDLNRMGLAAEMDTVSMVSMIERLLSVTQKREWVLRIETRKVTSKNLFSELMEFLLQERRIIKYMDHDLRTVGKSRNVHHSHCQDITTDDSSSLLNKVRGIEERHAACQQQMTEEIERVNSRLSHLLQAPNGSKGSRSEQTLKKLPTTSFSTRCWVHGTSTHGIERCNVFINMTLIDKQDAVRKAGAYFNCLQQSGHIARDCNMPNQCNVFVGAGICGKRHHSLLHKTDTATPTASRAATVHNAHTEDLGVLLAMSTATSNDKHVTILWDSGSDVSLITHKAAARLDIRGRDVDVSIVGVGNNAVILKSKEYSIPLVDLEGKLHNVCAFGMDEITSSVRHICMEQIAARFPHIKTTDISRPEGGVDMLIGVDHCAILPAVVDTVENIQLLID